MAISKDVYALNPILRDPAIKRARRKQIDDADTLLAQMERHAPELAARFVREFHFQTFRIDLVDEAAKLAIEVDGGQRAAGATHHGGDRDYHKTREITLAGWLLLRFTAAEVRNNPIGCIDYIRRGLALREATSTAS